LAFSAYELSGGQRQRIGLARALILNPRLAVCDEPVSALDASVQSQIINLLLDLQEENGVAYLFIAHNMSAVRFVSARIGVMYLGRLIEESRSAELFSAPAHPYTKALISAIPKPVPQRRRKRIILDGEVPSPVDIPSGCVFHTRCPRCMPVCREEMPAPQIISEGHWVACHNV
jgi:oligopeptide/dipeptide ABC transporter ATP-binding protein